MLTLLKRCLEGVHRFLNWAVFLVGMAVLVWGLLLHIGWL